MHTPECVRGLVRAVVSFGVCSLALLAQAKDSGEEPEDRPAPKATSPRRESTPAPKPAREREYRGKDDTPVKGAPPREVKPRTTPTPTSTPNPGTGGGRPPGSGKDHPRPGSRPGPGHEPGHGSGHGDYPHDEGRGHHRHPSHPYPPYYGAFPPVWGGWHGGYPYSYYGWYADDYYYSTGRWDYLRGYPVVVPEADATGTLFREAPESEAMLICYPPAAIPLGTPVPVPSAVVPGEVEARLAGLVNEVFYAPLSTRLLNKSLHEEQRLQLEAYVAERGRQLEILRNGLRHAEELDPSARETALAALAREQGPALRKLEQDAEVLRSGLLRKGLAAALFGSGSWRDRRDWTVQELDAESNDKQRLYAGFVVLRAAAYEQDGLGAAQRHLLREAALVRKRLLQGLESEAELPVPLYFSPECAQWFLPEGLPAGLREQLLAYAAEKERMREGLVAQVLALDSVSDKRRRQALEAFCAAQTAGLEVLEASAEHLRSELAKYPNLFLPKPRVKLPEELRQTLVSYERERRKLAGEYAAEYQRLSREASPAELRPLPVEGESVDRSAPQSLTLGVAGRMPEERRQMLRESLGKFNEQAQARHAALQQQSEALEPACKAWLETPEGKASGLTAESLRASIQRELAEEEAWVVQAEYRQAILQPGLGIEQRRLLFGAALSNLGLPLPPPE